MKQKNGIGFVKLIIGIIVIVIVVILAISYAKKEIDKEMVKNVQADLLLVQAKIELVKGNYSMDKENNPLKGYQLTQLPEDISIQDFYDKNIITQDEYERYYLLTSEALEQCGLGELVGNYDGYFIVNYDDYEVIYTKGYENTNGLWCYKLSELNKANEPENQQIVAVTANTDTQENGDNNNAEGNSDNNNNNNDNSEANSDNSTNDSTESNSDDGINDNAENNLDDSNNDNAESNSNDSINGIYNEINSKIKEGIIRAKEKSQEVSILVE